jgi:tetratricopeptide (TPR) repeat protein
MKIVTTLIVLLVLFFGSFSYSQTRLPLPEASQHASVTQQIGLTNITIDYHRPAVNGRTIWGRLVPYNEVWRAGANENTTITFSDPVKIAGKDVPAGSYGIHMIPGENEWIVIINKFAKAWGSFYYKQEEDLMRFNVKPVKADYMEYLNYNFETSEPAKTTVIMHWENLKVPFDIAVDVHEVTVKALSENLRNLNGFFWQPYQQAAMYLINNKTHLDLAQQWVDRSILMNRNFLNLSTKAALLELNGNKAEADKLIEEALPIANEAEINTYGYTLLQAKKIDEAIEIFRLNAERYPDSWNVYDSLAEGYQNKGEMKLAEEYYKIALEKVKDENQKIRITNTLKVITSK